MFIQLGNVISREVVLSKTTRWRSGVAKQQAKHCLTNASQYKMNVQLRDVTVSGRKQFGVCDLVTERRAH